LKSWQTSSAKPQITAKRAERKKAADPMVRRLIVLPL